MTKRAPKATAKPATKSSSTQAANPAPKPASQAEAKPTPAAPPVRRDAFSERVIRVRGAKEHNLKNVDLTIPRDRLVVMTGLSGSGKSSLAFDTIFAEGQRKYMESLSAYARQFLDQLKKPDVEEIEGIPPTIAIEQRSSAHNPRSTVATTTEIYDYLRLLFARCGTPRSWAVTKEKKDGTVLERSGVKVQATSASQIVDHLMTLPESTRLMVIAPVVRGKKGFHKDTLESLSQNGWARARVNGQIVDLREVLKNDNENPLDLHRHKKHDIDAVIDRVSIAHDARQRLAESVEAALRLADGAVVISVEESGGAFVDRSFSTKFADPDHPEVALEELSPRLFSFNSPFGACPTCHGLGAILEFAEDLVVPEKDKAILSGGIAPWKKNGPGGMIYPRYLRRFCRVFNIAPATPMDKIDPETYEILLRGTTPEQAKKLKVQWDGVLPMLRAWFEKTESTWVKDHLHQYQRESVCHHCHRPPRPRRHDAQHRRAQPPEHHRCHGVHRRADAHPGAVHHRRADPPRGRQPAAVSHQRRAGVPLARPAHRHALGRRGPAHPPRHAGRQRASSARAMCSTSPPSACTSVTTTGSSPRCATWPTSATPCWWSSTMRT
jgi:excinuclease ABC A subunit